MSDFISRAFTGKRRVPPELAARLPPGQYLETGFPVYRVCTSGRAPSG
ncbi:MAG TPA: hypothetical protein VK655_13325 [Solirubrobacteraceae bacterium]|jgi:hypothetical protein|nr:hypothetical protein [Solirubrobacteraceae bacterium]